MKVEMIRSRVYKGRTLESGRIVDVDDTFGRWLISKGMAAEYVRPAMLEAPKRERPTKGT
jgi:hypothetical protein